MCIYIYIYIYYINTIQLDAGFNNLREHWNFNPDTETIYVNI